MAQGRPELRPRTSRICPGPPLVGGKGKHPFRQLSQTALGHQVIHLHPKQGDLLYAGSSMFLQGHERHTVDAWKPQSSGCECRHITSPQKEVAQLQSYLHALLWPILLEHAAHIGSTCSSTQATGMAMPYVVSLKGPA